MRRMRNRHQQGTVLIECAAALAWGLPILMLMLFVAVQLGSYTLATEQLACAAREAARGLATAYGQDETIANNRSMQESIVFNNIRKPGFVTDSSQFQDPVFTTQTNGSVTMTSVKVTVTLNSEQNNCVKISGALPLPTQISQSQTYRCE